MRLLLILALVCFTTIAESRPRTPVPQPDLWALGGPTDETRANRSTLSTPRVESTWSRPSGCPRRWCGCWASMEVFGRQVPGLFLARNWSGFPPASPAPGMAGWRNGHVFVLKSHVEGDIWMVSDGNSGRGMGRLHARSIRGYRIVNPSGQNKYAMAKGGE
jgi:hypothetical protein